MSATQTLPARTQETKAPAEVTESLRIFVNKDKEVTWIKRPTELVLEAMPAVLATPEDAVPKGAATSDDYFLKIADFAVKAASRQVVFAARGEVEERLREAIGLFEEGLRYKKNVNLMVRQLENCTFWGRLLCYWHYQIMTTFPLNEAETREAAEYLAGPGTWFHNAIKRVDALLGQIPADGKLRAELEDKKDQEGYDPKFATAVAYVVPSTHVRGQRQVQIREDPSSQEESSAGEDENDVTIVEVDQPAGDADPGQGSQQQAAVDLSTSNPVSTVSNVVQQNVNPPPHVPVSGGGILSAHTSVPLLTFPSVPVTSSGQLQYVTQTAPSQYPLTTGMPGSGAGLGYNMSAGGPIGGQSRSWGNLHSSHVFPHATAPVTSGFGHVGTGGGGIPGSFGGGVGGAGGYPGTFATPGNLPTGLPGAPVAPGGSGPPGGPGGPFGPGGSGSSGGPRGSGGPGGFGGAGGVPPGGGPPGQPPHGGGAPPPGPPGGPPGPPGGPPGAGGGSNPGFPGYQAPWNAGAGFGNPLGHGSGYGKDLTLMHVYLSRAEVSKKAGLIQVFYGNEKDRKKYPTIRGYWRRWYDEAFGLGFDSREMFDLLLPRLEGEAKRTAVSFENHPKDPFYETWVALEKQYGGARQTAIDYMNELLEVQSMPANVAQCGKFVTDLRAAYTNFLALGVQGTDTSAFKLILFAVITKKMNTYFNQKFFELWERKKTPTDPYVADVTVEELFELVDTKVREKKEAQSYTSKAEPDTKKSGGQRAHAAQAVGRGQAPAAAQGAQAPRGPGATGSCLVRECESNHKLWKCPKFSKLTPEQRWKLVDKSGLCKQCLNSDDHLTADCGYGRCELCNGQHNKLVCRALNNPASIRGRLASSLTRQGYAVEQIPSLVKEQVQQGAGAVAAVAQPAGRGQNSRGTSQRGRGRGQGRGRGAGRGQAPGVPSANVHAFSAAGPVNNHPDQAPSNSQGQPESAPATASAQIRSGLALQNVGPPGRGRGQQVQSTALVPYNQPNYANLITGYNHLAEAEAHPFLGDGSTSFHKLLMCYAAAPGEVDQREWQTVRVLIDSGADLSMIDPKLANSLSLSPQRTGPLALKGITGHVKESEQTHYVQLDLHGLNGHGVYTLEAAVVDGLPVLPPKPFDPREFPYLEGCEFTEDVLSLEEKKVDAVLCEVDATAIQVGAAVKGPHRYCPAFQPTVIGGALAGGITNEMLKWGDPLDIGAELEIDGTSPTS